MFFYYYLLLRSRPLPLVVVAIQLQYLPSHLSRPNSLTRLYGARLFMYVWYLSGLLCAGYTAAAVRGSSVRIALDEEEYA